MVFNQYNEYIMDYQQATFDGLWKFNKRNGFGIMNWPDGGRFEGEWSNDFRSKGKQFMTD